MPFAVNRWLGSVGRDLTLPPANQNPALDALRSLAVLLVVACHVGQDWAKVFGTNDFAAFPLVRHGWSGVDLFFVLSGYLIGRQLLRELRDSNDLRVGRFLLRRGLRIWPLYFATIFAVLAFDPVRRATGDWWTDLLFLTNYIPPGMIDGGWSLCVEEQFYLLAPFLFLGMARLKLIPPVGERAVLLGLLTALPLVRAWIWADILRQGLENSPSPWQWRLYLPIHTHCDGLIVGLLLAHLEIYPPKGRWTRWLNSPLLVPLAGLLLILGCRLHEQLFNFTGLALLFGSMACLAVRFREPWPGWAARPVFVLSRLSYGMYLNHPYLVSPVVDAVGTAAEGVLGTSLAFVLVVPLSMVVATVTFAVVERPFLQLRERRVDHPKPTAAGLKAIGPESASRYAPTEAGFPTH